MTLRKLMTTAIAIALLSLLGAARAQAQHETPKLELGLQLALLGLDGAQPVLPGATEPGFGGGIT